MNARQRKPNSPLRDADLSWIRNLPEVGTPIIRRLQQIEADRARAAWILDDANKRAAALLADAEREARQLLWKCADLWAPDEIRDFGGPAAVEHMKAAEAGR